MRYITAAQQQAIKSEKDECTQGETVKHRDIKYMNNKIEQSHRGIKAWYRPMKGPII